VKDACVAGFSAFMMGYLNILDTASKVGGKRRERRMPTKVDHRAKLPSGTDDPMTGGLTPEEAPIKAEEVEISIPKVCRPIFSKLTAPLTTFQKPETKRGRSVSFAGTPPEVKRRRSKSKIRPESPDEQSPDELDPDVEENVRIFSRS
jgi:hypothetical protein